MGRTLSGAFTIGALLFASCASASGFDPKPWLADLEQARQAFHLKYANWNWVETEHEVNIDRLFDESAERLRKQADEGQARAVFERIASKLADGHVEFDWPAPSPPIGAAAAPESPDLCGSLGYDSRQNAPGVAQSLPTYEPLRTSTDVLAAGIVTSGGHKVGVLRLGVFQPEGFPDLCRAASRALRIPEQAKCDDACSRKISRWAYDHLTLNLEERLRQLKAAGAETLLVDVTHNGGGSEWAEAVARVLTPKPLVSERLGFVRGEHWATHWREIGKDLRSFTSTASPADRKQLLELAAQADAALAEANATCSSPSCDRIGKAGFSTGLVGMSRSGALSGKKWATDVFSPSQYHYDDGVWDGPLIVLVDQETWSAAEEFAAILQDNGVAIVMGARTGGAGCGHTNGGTPTTLTNSRAILKLPDCVRFRADGSNEVRGILPDVIVASRANDGVRFRADLLAAKLPAAIKQAKLLHDITAAHAQSR
jgi:hypothetical protein